MAFTIEPSTEIADRCDFSLLCNERGIKHAIEVGTDQGMFARSFLDRWHGTDLLLVDDYLPYAEMPWGREGDRLIAALALAHHHGRFRFICSRSPGAARQIPPWIKPRFIYIDAGHDYHSVRSDLPAWWEVLDDDGILAGHDFTNEHPGVVAAVTEFAQAKDLVIRLTAEEDFPISWYCYKTEPEKLIHRLFKKGDSANPHYAGS